jgi:hypothetical protein
VMMYKVRFGLFLLVAPMLVWGGADKFIESSDYTDKEFKKCNISDYNDLLEGDDIQWLWVTPDTKLSGYQVNLRKVENKSPKDKKSITEGVKSAFQTELGDMKSKKGSQAANIDICVYDVQEYSPGKAWIPFAGGHQMQAGVGVEMIMSDKGGKTIAKFRHFSREGARIEDAAKEVAEDLIGYVSKN